MLVQLEKKDRVAILKINRPEALNALNADVLLALQSQILELERIHVLVITGEGPKSFVAGADIKQMSEMSPLQARAFAELGQGVVQLIEQSPFVTIAAVNGFALGGGLELALACDLIYASKNAKFGAPETNLGIIPGFGGTVNLVARVGYHRAIDLILTGRSISADEALSWGLVLESMEPEHFLSHVEQKAQALASKGIHSLLAAKRLVRACAQWDKERAYLVERESFATLFGTHEPREGMRAFLEKRTPKFED
jgi:enoyl-CoA hydratase